MAYVVVTGSQWGDEGKGKIVDWLSVRADIVVRFQGGHNAGHTLVIDQNVYKLSLLPSGIVRPGKISVIGNGVVIDPHALLKEIEGLRAQGVAISPDNLMVAENACLILSIHRDVDQLIENYRGANKIGTTGRGIGPAYEDKVGRRAIRIADLMHPETLPARLEPLILFHNALRRGLGAEEVSAETILEELMAVREMILPYTAPVWKKLQEWRYEGKRILFEGAQGTLLDIDHGTYPYVTSSSTVSGQAMAGSGLGMLGKGYVLGITKAYTTRVGSGPFPTEQLNELGEKMGHRGKEFGTVTGRKRRCGWFDAVLVRQAVAVSGIHGIALTKLDVLDGFAELNICTGYQIRGKFYDYLPANPLLQQEAEPIYETLDGWEESTYGARSYKDLPSRAIKYIRRIEELVGAPITILSTSPERDDTILLKDPFASLG